MEDIITLCREKRTALGLKQKELAELLGIHKGSICYFEKGRRNLSPGNTRKLYAWLGVELPGDFSEQVVKQYKAMLAEYDTMGLPRCLETGHRECSKCNRCGERTEP